jgi:hypothetical protein
MRKLFENIFWAGAFLMTFQSAWGFALEGRIGAPGDAWQTITIGYGFNDPVAPKNIYEEYRPDVPVWYYASDSSFISYYGNAGLTNIDAAFGILNGVMCGFTNTPIFLYSATNGITLPGNGLPGGVAVTLTAANTLDQYSTNLLEFSLENQQINYTAQTLGLLDMKSFVLHQMVLQLGLADPTRYVWTLHDRLPDPDVSNPTCPANEEYLVVQRNFDVTQDYPYSSYINGSLYNFTIIENCGNDPKVPYSAITDPVPADQVDNSFPPVAAGGLITGELNPGVFYDGLTRDDVAGLKYLLSTNNINWEVAASNSVTLVLTNIGAPVPLLTSNLGALIASSITNDPVTLAGLFPGLKAYGLTTNYYIGYITNTTSYYTNLIGSPVGSPPELVTVTTLTPTLITNYLTVFGNVVTNHYYNYTVTQLQTIAVTNLIGAPYGSPFVTNVTYKTVIDYGVPSGDYYLITSNLWGYKIDSELPFATVITTNVLLSATNSASSTSTNSASTNQYSFTENVLTYSTNYLLLAQPLFQSFPSPVPDLRRGLGRVEFIRANYDSILGQFFQPLTNDYTMVMITNSQTVVEYYQRVVTAPDFVFQAQDLTVPAPPELPYGPDATTTTPQFNTSAIDTQLAGPGTITPGGGVIVFNENENNLFLNGSLALYNDSTNDFLNQGTQYELQDDLALWGSFDGSTNYPVVYPSGASIANLMNQLVIQVAPASVPAGTHGVPYSVTFTATGGQPPYTWSAPGLAVPGLGFNSLTTTLSGTPAAAGYYNFTLQLTDSANRVVNLNYTITIQ